MIVRLALAATAAAVIGISAVAAQGDPITERRAVMKTVGGLNATATQLLTGKRPFSVEEAQKVLNGFAESATRMRKLFPADSKSGDTRALPAVWDKWDDFDAGLVKFADQSKAAAGKVTDLESFKTEIGTVRQNCGTCHKPYRGS